MLHPVDIVEVKIAIDTDGIVACLKELEDALYHGSYPHENAQISEKFKALESAIEDAQIYVSDA